jgi:hypothetical protein
MKSKEKQDGFNTNLMQILDRIENKMDKKIESRNLRSHMSHGERRETISVDRKHHHSPKNSYRKACNSSSPSHIIKHRKGTRVDELLGKMNKIKPPNFDLVAGYEEVLPTA